MTTDWIDADSDDDKVVFDGPGTSLFDGDRSTLPLSARKALVLLLKRTHLNAVTHPREWQAVLVSSGDITAVLNSLFLELVIDERNEVAYKRQAGRELPNRPFTTVLKERRYTAEEAALMLWLRREHQEARARGDSAAFVEIIDAVGALGYLRTDSSDQVKARDYVDRAIERLIEDDLLVRVRGDDDRLRISPVIETLLSVERVQSFVDVVHGGRDEATGFESTDVPLPLDADPTAEPDQ